MGYFEDLLGGLGGSSTGDGLDTSMLGNLVNNGNLSQFTGTSPFSQALGYGPQAGQTTNAPIGPTQPTNTTQPNSFNGMPAQGLPQAANGAGGQANPQQQGAQQLGLLGQQLAKASTPQTPTAAPPGAGMQMPQAQVLQPHQQTQMPTNGLLQQYMVNRGRAFSG